MTITLNILGFVLTFAAIGSAIAKLKKVPDVVAMMASVGVKPEMVARLAILEIAGGLGIIAGIWIPVIGTLATGGLVLYFLGAVLSHARVKSPVKDAAASLGILAMSLVTLYLQLKR